jgi:hypothetical protein
MQLEKGSYQSTPFSRATKARPLRLGFSPWGLLWSNSAAKAVYLGALKASLHRLRKNSKMCAAPWKSGASAPLKPAASARASALVVVFHRWIEFFRNL